MTNDLEQMLRSSLQQRAEDVEPTPELWRQVQRRVQRRRTVPLLVWTAAGVAAAVTAVTVVPGLLERTERQLQIQPVDSPPAVDGTPSEGAPSPAAAAPLTHYVAVVDGRLVLRGGDGREEVLWEGESEVRTLAVRPGSTPDDVTVAFVTSAEGMLDLRVVGGPAGDWTVGIGRDAGDPAVVPTPAWSPDGDTVGLVTAGEGGADLVLADLATIQGDQERPAHRSPLSLGDLADPARLRLQDWTRTPADERLLLTVEGRLLQLNLRRTGTGWEHDAVTDTGTDAYVVDIATAPDGTQYRLLAGAGSGPDDAEDAGLALEFGNERISFPDLPTASPSDVWMTAVDGGAIVGLGDQARLVLRDREGDSLVTPVVGPSYAAWVPTGSVSPGNVVSPTPTPASEGPRADGPLAASGVTPYVVVGEDGAARVVTGDGDTSEVILGPEHWSPEAAVSITDLSVRPGSTADDVVGVALLATEAGAELAWFHWNNGATAIVRMEGTTGLGPAWFGSRAPVWSPDGRHLAWVELSDPDGWTLRTVGTTADGRPSGADAGFGLEVGDDAMHVADWAWDEVDGEVARGRLLLVDEESSPWAGYVVAIERQGDGALAVAGDPEQLPMGTGAVDAAFRGPDLVTVRRGDDGWVVTQDGREVELSMDASDVGGDAIDLDVLADVAVVTHRRTGEAWVVDRAGGAATLQADAATTHGYDPIR